MNSTDIKNFEKPIFDTYEAEKNRIFASEIIFKTNMTNEEFWKHFFDYISNKSVRKLEAEKIITESVINIKDDSGKMKSYIVTEFELNNKLELATLSGGNLNKIFIESFPTKYEKEIKVSYIESRRTKNNLNDKDYKKQFAIYNSRIINKVIILKDYLLNQVREIR